MLYVRKADFFLEFHFQLGEQVSCHPKVSKIHFSFKQDLQLINYREFLCFYFNLCSFQHSTKQLCDSYVLKHQRLKQTVCHVFR